MSIINDIRSLFGSIIAQTEQYPRRDFYNSVVWSERLIGILGAKGIGKTTLLMQHFQTQPEKSLYLSLDNTLAATLSLGELANEFYLEGGRLLLLDEVHKYPNWSIEIKNIFDTLPHLKVVFSGSSAIQINAEKGDLSRRASIYQMPILSLREFVLLESKQRFPSYSLERLLTEHETLAKHIVGQLQPGALFSAYLRHGAYPFYREGLARFSDKLRRSVSYAIETDLVQVYQLDPQYIPRLKKLLQMVASAVPFTPNISALAQALEMSRASVLRYLQILEAGGVLALLDQTGRGYQKLSKPEKIYLDNTNLMYAFVGESVDQGTLRETFCMSQLRAGGYSVEVPAAGDFYVAGSYTLEVGGRNKKQQQIKSISNSFIVRDDIELGSKNVVPLWLLGFLY